MGWTGTSARLSQRQNRRISYPPPDLEVVVADPVALKDQHQSKSRTTKRGLVHTFPAMVGDYLTNLVPKLPGRVSGE